MRQLVRAYRPEDLTEMTAIWNEVVSAGDAFPQREPLTEKEAEAFFASQSFCGVSEAEGSITGLYILHPNNVGRCGHIANASYAVRSGLRGQGTGRALVEHCLRQAQICGFRILQFNAVVSTNMVAIRLYEALGFVRLGTVPGGFQMKDGGYEDVILFYHTL